VNRIRRFEKSKRLRTAFVLLLVGVPNLFANACWLRTGDVHEPNWHAVMRGGWPAFWVITIGSLVAVIWASVLLLREWRTAPPDS
jgi:hypothetical protein